MTVVGSSLERRAPQLVEDTVSVERDPARYVFTHVPYTWSHADTGYWVNQWSDNFHGARDGAHTAFFLSSEIDVDAEPPALALTVRNDAAAGEHSVFFGSTAGFDACELRSCVGLAHATSAPLTVVER